MNKKKITTNDIAEMTKQVKAAHVLIQSIPNMDTTRYIEERHAELLYYAATDITELRIAIGLLENTCSIMKHLLDSGIQLAKALNEEDAANETLPSATHTVVHFHVGRGGRFHNAGFKEFKGAEDMTWPDEYCAIENIDEDGNPLPDEEWKLIVDSNRDVLLEGKDAIMSRTGTLVYNGDCNTDIYKYLEDCSDSEMEILVKAVERGDTWGLTGDDIKYINEWR